MSKKIVAMLMAVAMAFSLLPVTAFATGGTNGQAPVTKTASDKNLTMNKTVKLNKNGTYTVRLESYATGSVTTTQAPVPMDFVLVLDVSGSMTDEIASYTYQATNKTSWSVSDVYNDYYQKDKWGIPHRTDVTYYAKIDDEYYPVSYKQNWVSQGVFKGYYEYWLEANNIVLGQKVTDSTLKKEVYNKALYIRQTDSDKTVAKLDAMKTAVNNFITTVAAQKNGETPVAHRISIVKFAGDQSDEVGNGIYKDDEDIYNYTQKVTELTDVTANGSVASLKKAVNDLTAGGATAADWGMQKAKDVLIKRESTENPSIVIMFTDGEPNHGNGYRPIVAGDTVQAAKDLKDRGTKVYTIGMFKNLKPSNADKVDTYMNGVSSNYPEAVKAYNDSGVTLGTRAEGSNYYFKADNAGALDQVFQTISQSTTTTSPLDASAVVVDKVPSNFEAPISKDNVTLKVADYKADGTFGTETAAPSTIHASVNEDGTVSVTGFNFSENWCGLDGTTPNGKKLIIEFTIKCTNYGGTQPTNAGAYIKANADSTEQIISVDDPEVPVTISLGIPEAELNKKLGVSSQKEYDGSGISILSELSAKANTLVNGTNNAYVDMELTIKVDDTTTYTYKIPAREKTGSWYQGDQKMDPNDVSRVKTSQNVNRGENNAYTYKFDLKLSDATPNGAAPAKYENNTARFTITPAPVTVTADNKQVEKGTNPASITYTATVNGLVNGEQESLISRDIKCDAYTVNTAVGSELEITASGVEEQGNYTVTYWPGKLTVVAAPVTTGTLEVTKKVEGLALNELPEGFKIKVTNAGTTKAELSPTDQNVQKDETNGTLTWTIRDLPAGEYTVSESNADVTGYDRTATYNATNGDNDASAVQNQPATDAQASQKVTVTAGQTRTMTVTNKYTEKEVEPPTPPTPSDPVKLDVSRSKIASDDLTKNSNGDWTTDVTLSLPSAEYKPVIDVVFILDDSHAGNEIFKDAATSLLIELSQKENVDVNVGIVNFDAVARDWVAATTNSQYFGLISVKNAEGLQALNTAIATKLAYEKDGQTKKVGATNIEWPLEMAQNMLASGKGTEKYAILFSDMYGYVYRGDLKIGETTYENVPLSKRYFSTGGSLSMGTKYTNFADVCAHRNDKENQTHDGFFRDSSWDNYWGIYSGYTLIPTNPVTADNDPFHVSGGYSGFEKSTCLVYDRLLQMKQAGINLSIVNNDFTFTDGQYIQPIKNEMLDELGKQGICVIKTQENPTADEVKNVFATLKDQLIQVVSAGSTVTDQIGTKFDFVGLDTMTLKIGDETMVGTIDKTTNTITFKHGDKNDAHVVVYDSDANSFQWTINEDVTKDARVQLTYTVKLKTPQTLAGTYGVKDLNGDGKVDDTGADVDKTKALYTNKEAKLVPKDSNGNKGAELTFLKPSVSYTIKSSSGSHSGGSRPSLNTKDHYGYIIGYPVDYYTGQPTTDQTKKPVRPEGKITRAEVATIYFRMLTDESRTKFWSQNSGYSDVKTGDWFNNAVSTLSNAGIIAGYEDGSFRPNGYITRAEFATIAARFFDVTYNGKDLFPDISGHWAKDYINQAANKGFVNGYEDGTFKPDRNITRAEAVTLVNRTLDRHPDKSHFTKDMLVWPDNMDQTKWYYADMQEATNSHTYQMKENSDKTKYENWTKTLPIRNWEALEKAWSNANSSQGNGNVV